MSTTAVLEPVLSAPPPSGDNDELYEIVDGQRVEVPPMSVYAVVIASRLAGKLNNYAEAHGIGEAVGEVLVRLPLEVNRNRRPDVSFVSYQRWPKGRPIPVAQNAWDVVPNLAVEVISPTDLSDEIMEKIDEYFRAGVELVWVVYPRLRLVHVFEALTKIKVVLSTDELDGGTVLPGFRLPLSALFLEPPASI